MNTHFIRQRLARGGDKCRRAWPCVMRHSLARPHAMRRARLGKLQHRCGTDADIYFTGMARGR
jgi:murein endopeptidase